ncbi:MAG: DUF4293 domain-containing protein [Paludibacteraceae bacterium]|nr:DUF4293 domain-containing protein [Paludibacteraceae bacterium]
MAVVALGITLCFMPVLEFYTPENADTIRIWQLSATGLEETTVTDLASVTLQGLWGLTVATILIPLLALVDIFLFKKRILQARLNIFSVMLCLGYYGVLAIYGWLAKEALGVEWHILPWSSIPAVCLVLTFMATRRILKDEALVRAADRIR